jgi:CheY-like chemotaxis protein
LRSDRALGDAAKSMRLIALTGYGRDTDVELALEAGFDAHLVKPYDFDELEKLMAQPMNATVKQSWPGSSRS